MEKVYPETGRWTFFPEGTQTGYRKAYKPKNRERNPNGSWKAPEHEKITSDMQRDFPRDDLGRKIEGRGRELVLDPRPTIMIPPRPTYSNPLL